MPPALFFDFDGTLAPIVHSPKLARLPTVTRATLERLGARADCTVTIVSGRGRLADVRDRVGIDGLIYAGNHGLEIEGPGFKFVEPTAAASVRPGARDGRRTDAACGPTRRLVEPKGLTTSIHYRNVPSEHRDDLARIVHEAVGTDPTRFVLTTGHSVWEIRPRVAWHKGQAIHWVLQQLGDPMGRLVLYLGDDRTDEDAFACLPDGITVKVGSPGLAHPGPLPVARPRFRACVPGMARGATPPTDPDSLQPSWPRCLGSDVSARDGPPDPFPRCPPGP